MYSSVMLPRRRLRPAFMSSNTVLGRFGYRQCCPPPRLTTSILHSKSFSATNRRGVLVPMAPFLSGVHQIPAASGLWSSADRGTRFSLGWMGAAAAGAVVTTSAVTYLNATNPSNKNKAPAPRSHYLLEKVLAASLRSNFTCQCDGAVNHKAAPDTSVQSAPTSSDEPSTEAKEGDDENDPYDNLPDEDEDTHCSMCNTFRKGPCRPYWRKLERCFKDHENEENGALQCMKYFYPHQQCLQKYLNFYQLVSLDMKQELVRDTEKAVTPDERRSWDVIIQWGLWKQFVNEQGLDFRQTVRRRSTDLLSKNVGELLPFWQRLPDNLEPVLLTVTSPLPKHKDGMILKIAYAVDQDGFVLGFSYNQAYQALLEQSLKKSSADEGQASNDVGATESTVTTNDQTVNATAAVNATTDSANNDDVTQNTENTSFEFVLLPGETKTVRVCALYSENPVTASPEKDLLDVLLYTSPSYSVKEGAQS